MSRILYIWHISYDNAILFGAWQAPDLAHKKAVKIHINLIINVFKFMYQNHVQKSGQDYV